MSVLGESEEISIQQNPNLINAGFGKRLLSYIIDSIFVFFICSLLYYLFTLSFYFRYLEFIFLLVFFIVNGVYHTILIALFGRTIGKKFLGLKVISYSGDKLSFLQSFRREFIYKSLSFFVLNLGFLFILLDKENRAWHDRLGHTRVIVDKYQDTKINHKNPTWRIIFFGLLTFGNFIGEFIFLYTFLLLTISNPQINPEISCYFVNVGQIEQSNHFQIFVEKGKNNPDIKNLKVMFEQAFDYTFWLFSSISTGTTHTTVCLYQNQDSYNKATRLHRVSSWAFAFYSVEDRTIHFSPDFLKISSFLQQDTIFHEVSHFLMHHFLSSKNYNKAIPHWFEEGIAESISKNYTHYDLSNIKLKISKNYKSWTLINNEIDSLIDSTFTINDFYDESYLIILFLRDRYGEDVVGNMVKVAGENNITIEQAIEYITHLSFQNLEDEWIIWLKQK